MEPGAVREFELENSHKLLISDASKKVAEDSYFVVMKVRMDIKIEKTLFSQDEQKEFFFEDILEKLGETAVYEYTAERKFIDAKVREETFEMLVNDFFSNIGQYVSKPYFPKKVILKQYKDVVEKRTKKLKAI